MILIGDKETYCFEGIHMPRIYIHDAKKVKYSLELLQKKGSLTNQEMTKETERVRSEDIREIYYLLWRLGLGVEVSKKGRNIIFVANEELESISELSKEQIKKLILEKLKEYNPFIATLDRLLDYKKKNKSFTEKDITKDFHNGRDDGGRVDNTHPLLRWSKDEEWGLVKDNFLTKKGEEYISNAKLLNIFYVHHTIDLEANNLLNIVCYILSKSFLEKKTEINYDELLDTINIVDNLHLNQRTLKEIISKLINKGLPISQKGDIIKINNRIYHEITPKYYVKFGLNHFDGISEFSQEDEKNKFDFKKLVRKIKDFSILFIADEAINKDLVPKEAYTVSYEEFLEINEFIPETKINTIILSPGWKPLKVSEVNGILLSFVGFGGNLIVFHAPKGRIGSNRNLFNWLPEDLSRISFVHNSSNLGKGYFTFPLGERLYLTEKSYKTEIEKRSNRYILASFKYKQGLIITSGYHLDKNFFNLDYILEVLKNKIVINKNSKKWIYRKIPSMNRWKNVNTEYNLYPILRKILKENLNLEFDKEITGKSGQTDLFIESPFFCCCEVTPPGMNATGFSKVAEVEGHRKTMVFKDKRRGFTNKNVGACVIGPSFTIEAGEDKSGAVDMANAMNISLISYRDIYELLCISEEMALSNEDIKSIFFNETKEAEASLRINKLKKFI